MTLSEENKKNLKILGMTLILTGISIQFYLLWNEGHKEVVTSSVMRQGISTLSNMGDKI